MRKRFSDQLLRYSARVVRRERLVLLNAPEEVVQKEEALIEKATNEMNAADHSMIKLAIEEELILGTISSINSPSCWNCIGNKGLGDCNIAKAIQILEKEMRNATCEIQKERVANNFDSFVDASFITENAHKRCDDYQVNDELFNSLLEEKMPLINVTVEKYALRRSYIELEIIDKLNHFADNALPTPGGITH